jgi:capsular exopolysaccharide synthesis family protein
MQERIPMPPAMTRRPGPAGPSGSLNFSDVVRILKQRIFLILFIWFFMTGLTAALTWYLQKHYQLFKSETLVEIKSPNVRDPFEVREIVPPVDLLNRYVIDQAQLVKHRRVLDQALLDTRVTSTQWYKYHLEHKNNLIEEMQDELSVTPVPNTSFIAVSFATRNKEDGARIVDTIVDKYIAMIKSESTSVFAAQLARYRTELQQLEGQLKAARAREEEFMSRSMPVPGLGENINVPSKQWEIIATEQARLEAEALQLKAVHDNYQRMDLSQMMLTPAMQASIDQDPLIMNLNSAVMGLEQQLAVLTARAGRNSRDVRNLEMNLAVVRAKLEEVTRRKEEQVRKFHRDSTEAAWLNALQASIRLKDKASEFESLQRDLDSKLATLRTIKADQEVLDHQYEKMWDYVQQLQLLVDSRETVRVSQVGKAVEPLKPSFPRWELNMPVGSFLGLLMGIGLALLLELANTSIRTPRDLVRHVHTPILGTVPDLDDEEVAIERMELAAHAAPRSMIAEAFRTIRTNLLLSSPAERQRTVLVTSAKPEEGKTSVAVNLAISIGQSGRRVLLVDANFHRPGLQNVFPQAKREGLSNILIGRGKLADLASPTELPNLEVLTCGPIPPNPTELLAGRYLAELIGEAAGRYDQVIFDGPPVLLVSDALVLASAVDGVVLVCRAKTASRGTVQRAREQLERVNARVFGAVLNAAQVARGGYFREQMRSYYDYQPEEARLAGTTRALPKTDAGENKEA